MSQDIQSDIDEILDWFDFDRVHQVMVALDWRWTRDDESEVPEKAKLRQRARRLIQDVTEYFETNTDAIYQKVSSGGFSAEGHRDIQSGRVDLELSFVVASWDNWENS